MIGIRFYRIYDVEREIDLDSLEQTLARNYFTARASFLRVSPKSIMMENPPLLISMHPVTVEREGRLYELNAVAKVYDIGAISLCFVYHDTSVPSSALIDTTRILAGQDQLSDIFEAYLKNLNEILPTHIASRFIDPDFYEDYTIYITDTIDPSIDTALLLNSDQVLLSSHMREEIEKNTLSYTRDDQVILSWDSALICNPESPTDIIELIEFATVQVLELRYYDRLLTNQMTKMYDVIEQADRLPSFRRAHQYHAIMAQLMELFADISEITDKINNLIKVTEDIYYARVYAMVLKVLRISQWSDSVDRKIDVIYKNYTMLSDEVRIQHSNFLEWIIIVLIALEFLFAIWQYFR